VTGTAGTVGQNNSITGDVVNDQVGSGGVVVLSNGNYVVRSIGWRGGARGAANGAVTFALGDRATSAVVSSENSLVGAANTHRVGAGGVVALPNGNYVVVSPFWDNGTTTDVGAVTWGSGLVGIKGFIGAENSLIGSKASDRLGSNSSGAGFVQVLSDGSYLVTSSDFDATVNGATIANTGALTFGSATGPLT
ncbi:hypothetical protein ABEQ61_12355, partial [Cutibacterium acnes]